MQELVKPPMGRGIFGSVARLLPYGALICAVIFWGASFPAVRCAVGRLDPMAVMFCRMTIACVIMAPFFKTLFPSRPPLKDMKLIIPMVLLQPCLYFLLESNALKLTTSSQAGVISASVPLLVAIGAWLFLSEHTSKNSLLGLMVSVAGVVILTLYGENSLPGDNPLLGNTMEFAAMVCAAGNLLLVKILSRRYNPWTLTAMQCLAGLVFFSPGLCHVMAAPDIILDPGMVFSLLFLGAFASVGAFGMYNWAMGQLPATGASVFINLVPVVAVILGWTLLGESLGPGQMAGAVLVGSGVLISQKNGKGAKG